MEAAAGVSAVSRSGSLSVPSSSRKEWRAVSEQHHSVRNVGDDTKLEQSKMEQLDERTIYEHGREPVDVDFCSITVDRSSDDDILQQQIHGIARKREELQQLETELRAQMIARSEIIQVQNNFNAQIKEREDTVTKLQEQLRQTGQSIHDLERRIEEKDRELHAIKLDNEAAWAKQDILREQNKELATFRRERDHSEAERVQHIQQIRELQEHIQEKDRQVLELQEQHRADQEAIFVKDEQLKAWIARVQELDAMQSTTNHSLQAELRERTEQYNQLWLGCQRQFLEMERLHLHTVQQLQLELADARERSGFCPDNLSQMNSKDRAKFVPNNRNQLDLSKNGASKINNEEVTNGNADKDNASSFASTGNPPSQIKHIAGVPISPSSLLGMPAYLPPGKVTTLHPIILHQQGIPQSMLSPAPQSHADYSNSIPGISSLPQWPNQQVMTKKSQFSVQHQVSSSQADHSLNRLDAKNDYEVSNDVKDNCPGYLDTHSSAVTEPESSISSSSRAPQVLESIDKSYSVEPQPDQSLHQITSQFNSALRLNPIEQNSEIKDQNAMDLNDYGTKGQVLTKELPSLARSLSLSETSTHYVNPTETTISNHADGAEIMDPAGKTDVGTSGKTFEASFLDERSLLACIVRTIPAGGRIRINSTLPNRLGKMLAPLHWHDYKKAYGKLDDFVAGHPELFLVEGDYIQLREGAQQMISAKAAVAKVAAATSSPYSSSLPPIAVTPMAQSNRLKKSQSVEMKHPKGVSSGVLIKTTESHQLNGSADRLSVTSSQSKGSVHEMSNSNFGKQQSRTTRAVSTNRR